MLAQAWDEEDFGFSTISEEELKQQELQAKEEATRAKKKLASLQSQESESRKKLVQMHQMIMPLLNNLKKNPENEIIKWPNRAEKINEFIQKLDKLLEE